MCLAIPMQIVRIEGDACVVRTEGLERRANISLLKGARAGDYVLIHAGFAIERVKESEAKKTIQAIRSLR
jgi:hydrogenase expression/formation protein HypC